MSFPSTRPVTMRAIAQAVGVTHATVSLALRDDPRITQERRDEVKRTAQAMGYRPDPLLTQLASYRKSAGDTRVQSAIAWINDWENPRDYFRQKEFEKYHEGACAMAERLGFHLEDFNTRVLGLTQKRLGEILASRRIRGIIIPPHVATYEIPDELWREFTILRIGFNKPTTRRHIVCPDQYEGGRIAAKGILEAGYRRIGFVSDVQMEEVSRNNFSSGFRSTRDPLVAASAQVPDLLLKSQNQVDGFQLYQRWLKKNRVDAVFFRVDKVPAWTKRLGYAIGRDVGLAGSSYHDSGVDSGVDQRPREIGSVAVQFISSLMTHREFGVPLIPQRVMISPTWIVGTSLQRGP